MLISVLSESTKGAAVELAPYFIDSFGNSTRIDYGSGKICYAVKVSKQVASTGVFVGQLNIDYQNWFLLTFI